MLTFYTKATECDFLPVANLPEPTGHGLKHEAIAFGIDGANTGLLARFPHKEFGWCIGYISPSGDLWLRAISAGLLSSDNKFPSLQACIAHDRFLCGVKEMAAIACSGNKNFTERITDMFCMELQ